MKTTLIAATCVAILSCAAAAQQAAPTPPPAAGAGTPAEAEAEFLKVYFPSGSARIAADQRGVLDEAVRTFRDGDPYVMIVSGLADTVGAPDANLDLSLRRATAVADALSARGIPIERLQVLGRGNSELAVRTGDGVAEAENRVVEISWR